MFFHVFYCNIKVNHCLYHFIMLLHLIFFCLLARSLIVPYTYVSIESMDYILLSSFELKAALLISSVKTLCLPLLNLCYVFNIDLLSFTNSLWFYLILSMLIFFFLYNLFHSQIELLRNSFCNFETKVFFLWHTFFCLACSSSLPSSIK